MRCRTRHLLVLASIIAVALLDFLSMRPSDVLRNPRGDVQAATEIGASSLLVRPRVTPPPATKLSVPAVRAPGLLTLSHADHFLVGLADLSLQKEHIRLQI